MSDAPGAPRRWWRSRGLWMIGLVLCGGGLLWGWLDAQGGPEALRERWGLGAALVLVPMQVIVAASPFPGEVIAVANSLVYGFWLGALFNWTGWMAAAFLQRGVVARTARDLDLDRALARLPAWLRRFPVEHPVFQIVGRLLPFGGHVVNSASGLYRTPGWRFTWCAAVGLAPGSFFFAAVATGLLTLRGS